MAKDLHELLGLLDLETIDDNLFRGAVADMSLHRVFGGQVAAQALVAGTRTVDPEFVVHSLHSYFLQPGDPRAPILYDVDTLRDGRSFHTRRVLARQHGRPIFALTASFQRPEDGLTHQDRMPQVPAPDEVPARDRGPAHADADAEWAVADIRLIGTSAAGLPADPTRPGRQRSWLRIAERLPEDPFLHLAAFTYLTDMTVMGAALAPHGLRLGDPRVQLASLDHAIWFHRPFRADEWWLYDQVSPSASGGRGLVTANVFTHDGQLAATVAQEFLMRPVRAKEES
ncbi:acyl-CoA thioesterase II [Nocardioides sp. dk4132]|uniref:acyl-CoA thioesterase n=1 Tax=unclassified Nocardioides TaxID=2615069 RepID=UPI001295D323|nr:MULTISPECIES: acyl-CoA thioesterase II [unclassified Nocardioides]MQW74945.1 acyl-CoA thioesterase II [Nocardioides sp. dk4132]QGA07870.1 acyl-CoA thioesterase II [Nocardioides sp. dk884]